LTPDERGTILSTMPSRREWWDQPNRARRKAPPFAAIVALVFLAFGAFLLLVMRPAEPPKETPAPAGSGEPSAIEDPATLEPFELAVPSATGDQIFSSRLMVFAIALNQSAKRAAPGEGEEVARAEGALSNPDVAEALGARAAAALGELVSAAKVAVRASSQDDASGTALEIAVAHLDNALLAGRQPYFVDSMVGVDPEDGRRFVLLSEFAVVATDLYTSAGARVRAVRLRRLDKMSFSHTLLGFVNAYRPQAMVLVDQIEEQLVDYVLPALASGAPMPMLASHEGESPGDAGGVSAEGGNGVRADVAELPGFDPDAGRELGEALRARRALYAKWNERARARRRKVEPASTMEVDVAEVERVLGDLTQRAEIDELRRIQKRLARTEVARSYETLRDAFAASIERHEVQHRLDVLRPTTTPDVIDALVPSAQIKAVVERRRRIQSELSAYLAQLARDDLLPHVTFALIVRFLVDPKLRGSAESYAAIAAIEELARELAISDVVPVFHDHKVDDVRVGRAYRQIVAARGSDLSAAAKRVWARLFGAPLAPLADTGAESGRDR
jgi:hypothetical protein